MSGDDEIPGYLVPASRRSRPPLRPSLRPIADTQGHRECLEKALGSPVPLGSPYAYTLSQPESPDGDPDPQSGVDLGSAPLPPESVPETSE